MMFNRKLKENLKEAESIIFSFDTMLSVAHLSENRSAACNYARREIADYYKKWSKP